MSQAFENVVKLRGINTVYLAEFNVAGDGITDDRAAIQSAIDATPVGATLVFDGLPHRINSKLVIKKAINVDFANSALILNNSASPFNRHFDIYSETGDPVNWTQSIVAGQNSFNLSTNLQPGDYIVLQLGVGADPHDPNEEHYVRVCRVIANTGSVLTVDVGVPYPISGTSHRIRKITSLTANCTFKNLVLDYVDGTTPDTHIYQYWVFNVIWENVRAIKARIVFNPFDSHNVVFKNINATLVRAGISSHGRVWSGWQVENAMLENVTATSLEDGSQLFFESWCRQIEIKNASLTSTNTVSNTNMIQVSGSSYDIVFDGLLIDADVSKNVIGSGADPSFYTIKNLRMVKYPRSIPAMDRIQSFADVEKNVNFNSVNGTVFSRIEVSMQASWTAVSRFLCRGVMKNLWIYVEDKTELTSLFVLNSNGNGLNVTSQLIDGEWTQPGKSNLMGYGLNIPFNNPSFPVKRLVFTTTAGMVPGTKLTAVSEYWPMIGTDQYLFPIEMDV